MAETSTIEDPLRTEVYAQSPVPWKVRVHPTDGQMTKLGSPAKIEESDNTYPSRARIIR